MIVVRRHVIITAGLCQRLLDVTDLGLDLTQLRLERLDPVAVAVVFLPERCGIFDTGLADLPEHLGVAALEGEDLRIQPVLLGACLSQHGLKFGGIDITLNDRGAHRAFLRMG